MTFAKTTRLYIGTTRLTLGVLDMYDKATRNAPRVSPTCHQNNNFRLIRPSNVVRNYIYRTIPFCRGWGVVCILARHSRAKILMARPNGPTSFPGLLPLRLQTSLICHRRRSKEVYTISYLPYPNSAMLPAVAITSRVK